MTIWHKLAYCSFAQSEDRDDQRSLFSRSPPPPSWARFARSGTHRARRHSAHQHTYKVRRSHLQQPSSSLSRACRWETSDRHKSPICVMFVCARATGTSRAVILLVPLACWRPVYLAVMQPHTSQSNGFGGLVISARCACTPSLMPIWELRSMRAARGSCLSADRNRSGNLQEQQLFLNANSIYTAQGQTSKVDGQGPLSMPMRACNTISNRSADFLSGDTFATN